jgi:energy-coupling factor transporter ATP-binding protein EcfA2
MIGEAASIDETPVAAAMPVPLRITSLTLCDFRAFPDPISFDLAAKNLLVYGENGSGKSSIFHALRHFFDLRPPIIASVKNVFSGRDINQFKVEVTFNDETPLVSWSSARHPSQIPGADPRVTETARRKSCLDYRALLDTNYMHGENRPNLFEVSVARLLADFPITVEGGTVTTIGELWSEVEKAKPWNYNHSLERIQKACVDFNEGLRSALNALHPHLEVFLNAMTRGAIAIKPFTFGGVTYQHGWWRRDRTINGRELFPEVIFNGYELVTPQTFLNEARLSALGLAMYLAGRLACVPAGGERLKLLVLDDVLIGLDHDNRTPVLRLLQDHFLDWQVVVLTHDRVWFDMARQFYEGSDQWVWAEIYADGDGGRANPSVKMPNGDLVRAALDDCTTNLAANSLPSAATSARRAFEWALKRFCERRRVQVPFTMNPKENDLELLLNAATAWVELPGTNRANVTPILSELRMYRAGVLNPQSHADAPNPSRQEIEGVLLAIQRLRAAISNNSIH